VQIDAVVKAEIDLLNAKLEMARSPAERVAIRKDILNHLRALEASVKSLVSAGAATPAALLRAQSARLQAEADLLRELAALKQKRGGAQRNMSGEGGFGAPGMGSMMAGMPPRGRTTFDLKPRTPTEQKILAALDSETKVDFDIGVSLRDAMGVIAEKYKITIIPDKKPLDDAQIKLEELQTRFTLSGVKLRSVLNTILKEHGLDYVLKDEVLQITTVEAANEYLETRVYDTTQLKGLDPTALQKMVQDQTSGAWKDYDALSGGSLTATSGSLVVRQTQRVHAEITNLLQELARLSPEALKPPPGTKSVQQKAGGGTGGVPQFGPRGAGIDPKSTGDAIGGRDGGGAGIGSGVGGPKRRR